MAGETATTTTHPRPWVCPTPDLDLSDVEWTTYEIKPGTPYEDEPSVMTDPGWYVHGQLPDHDPRDAPPVIIKIEAYDEHGCDRAGSLARHLAGLLAEQPSEPRQSRLRRFANGCADVIDAFIRDERWP